MSNLKPTTRNMIRRAQTRQLQGLTKSARKSLAAGMKANNQKHGKATMRKMRGRPMC